MKPLEGGKDGTEGDLRQGGPNLVGCDKEQGACSGFSETLLKALIKLLTPAAHS